MPYTMTIACPGQKPTKLTYHDARTAKEAARRFDRDAKQTCRIEVREPDGTVRSSDGTVLLPEARILLGGVPEPVCVKRVKGKCVVYRLGKAVVEVWGATKPRRKRAQKKGR
jgi:hypothetical protein